MITLHDPQLSVIAACLNEQEALITFVKRTIAVCQKEVGTSFEFILVNDGSGDATLSLMNDLAKEHKQIIIINLSRSFGHQAALTAGLSCAKGNRVFMLDADLQDPPEILPKMIHALDEGADIAFGQRTAREGDSWLKKIGANCFYSLFGRLTDTPMPKNAGDFRLMSYRAVEMINAMPEHSRFLRGMTSWIGLKQTPVPYQRSPRIAGKTKYPFRKMLGFAMDAITGFSILPLRLASYIGAAFGLFGLTLLIYVLRAWFLSETVQGWTSLMVVVLLIGSVQLLCLGVFGEYIGRLVMESKQRPLFIIENITRHKN